MSMPQLIDVHVKPGLHVYTLNANDVNRAVHIAVKLSWTAMGVMDRQPVHHSLSQQVMQLILRLSTSNDNVLLVLYDPGSMTHGHGT